MMSYRVDFWLNSVVCLVGGILIPYFMWKAIFGTSTESVIGGYTFAGMLLYYILAVLLCRIIQGPDLVLTLANDIYQGELSRYLLYPAGYAPFKYAQHLGAMVPGLVQVTLFGTIFALLLPIPSDFPVTPARILACIVTVAIGNLLYFLMAYPIQALAFWADNVWSLTVLLRFGVSLLGGLFLPLSLFPEWAQSVLRYSPFPYLFWFPVNTLIDRVPFKEWLAGVTTALAWCVVLALFGRFVWRRGELSYSGVGI